MAKRDIMQAYRNIPVHPQDQFVLGMHDVAGYGVYGHQASFVLRSAPLLFTVIATADALQSMLHYIGDFILLGRLESRERAQAASIMDLTCVQVGLPREERGPLSDHHFLRGGAGLVGYDCALAST